MAENDIDTTELIATLTRVATVKLRADRTSVLVASTAARHQLLNMLLNEAIEEAGRAGRPAVRASDAAMSAWVANYAVRHEQESGLPKGSGTFSNPESSTKQWYSEIRRPWVTDVSLEKGDWYRARLDFWRRGEVLFLAWRFFSLDRKNELLDVPQHDQPSTVKTREITRPDDAGTVEWFLGIPPPTAGGTDDGLYQVTLTERDLRDEAARFHRFCARLRRTRTFVYPTKKARQSDPQVVVKWPGRRPPLRQVLTTMALACLLVPVGCYMHEREESLRHIRHLTISAGAVCIAGRAHARMFFTTELAPPVEVRRNDELVGTMQATQLPDGRWSHVFVDEAVVPRKTYRYSAVKRMWGTGEALTAPTLSATIPTCSGVDNRVPTVESVRPPTRVVAGVPATFEAVNPDDADGEPLTFFWMFGGTDVAAGGPRGTHTFRSEGRYVVSVTVHDPRGGAATVSTTINVGPAPPGTVLPPEREYPQSGHVSPKTGKLGDEFTFTATPNPLEGCTSRFSYSFEIHLHSRLGHPVLSGWIFEPTFRTRLPHAGLWIASYSLRCGAEERGTFGLSDAVVDE